MLFRSRVVTAAALLFAVAVGAFATSEISLIKELGIGTAAAVLIDATIIRGVLLPAVMALLGERNWYLPKWLNRLPDLTHDEAPDAVTATSPVRDDEERLRV